MLETLDLFWRYVFLTIEMFPVRYDCFQIIYFLRVSKVLFTLILLYCTYIHFNLLSFYLVKSKASCNFCNVEDTIWVQEQTICSAVSIAVFSAPNRTILSKLNLLHSRLEDVYCKSFEVKLSKIEIPPHCFFVSVDQFSKGMLFSTLVTLS